MSEIPEAAVEAAAKAVYESELDLNKWGWTVAEIDREEYRKHARAALEAAAPHMLEGAYTDGYCHGMSGDQHNIDKYRPTP